MRRMINSNSNDNIKGSNPSDVILSNVNNGADGNDVIAFPEDDFDNGIKGEDANDERDIINNNDHYERYPYCIVWTPIPVLTWLLPMVGHMGICKSNGVIYDFGLFILY